jgi:flavin reductase (DIM6/NTAB) family NADH-FMN oxidoreductase RutF
LTLPTGLWHNPGGLKSKIKNQKSKIKDLSNSKNELNIDEAAGLVSPLYRDTLVIVTAAHQERMNGQVAMAALPASIVVEKPRVLIELWQNNLTHALVRDSAAFCLHLLREDQFEAVRNFGFYHGQDRNKFAGVAYNQGQTGSPRLEDCLGWLECRVIGQISTEDMTAFIGEVVAARRITQGEPLTWTVARKNLPPAWLEEYNQTVRRPNEEWARSKLGL